MISLRSRAPLRFHSAGEVSRRRALLKSPEKYGSPTPVRPQAEHWHWGAWRDAARTGLQFGLGGIAAVALLFEAPALAMRPNVDPSSLDAGAAAIVRVVPARAPAPDRRGEDPAFALLEEGTQKAVRDALVDPHQSNEGVRFLRRLATSPGFGAMSPADQARLIRFVGGTDPWIAHHARASLIETIARSSYRAAAPAQQANALTRFLRSEQGAPLFVGQRDFHAGRRPYSLSSPTYLPSFAFDGETGSAHEWSVQVEGKMISIVRRDQSSPPGTYRQTPEEIAKAIASLPAASLAELQQVQIHTGRSAADAHWAQLWGEPKFRAHMTAGGAGVVHVYPMTFPQPQHVVDAALIHESAHMWSRRTWGADGSAAWQAWSERMKSDGLHVSKYARNNAAEDFAESVTLYQLVRGSGYETSIRNMFPGRFQSLDQVMER